MASHIILQFEIQRVREQYFEIAWNNNYHTQWTQIPWPVDKHSKQ